MLRKIAFFLLFLLILRVSAQNVEKNVLFLLPFQLEENSLIEVEKFKTAEEILDFPPYELLGFWEGAKMAIAEIDTPNVHLNIFVRDISDDEEKLSKVLAEFANEKLDLIIGPFFAKLFPIAAEFAKTKETYIVNPFSTRSDFIDSNNFVFKLIPTPTYQPAILHRLLFPELNNVNIILWANGELESVKENYINYFEENMIPFKKVEEVYGVASLRRNLEKKRQNIVIALYENNARVIANLQALATDTNMILLAPESWLNFHNIDYQLFELLHLHFFSNYFVEYKDDRTELFMLDYLSNYNAPAQLERFSFQGYDVAYYFLNLLINDFDFSKVTYKPLSFDFEFRQLEGGGYENIKSRLISFSDFELIEVK